MYTGIGLTSPFTSLGQPQPYGFPSFGAQGWWSQQQGLSPYGPQQGIVQALQILPQQLQQVQQLAYVHHQLLQQLVQIVPAQLQQLQQAIYSIPHQVLQIVAQQQFGAQGALGGGIGQLTQPQGFGVPFPIPPVASPFAGAPGHVM